MESYGLRGSLSYTVFSSDVWFFHVLTEGSQTEIPVVNMPGHKEQVVRDEKTNCDTELNKKNPQRAKKSVI